MKKYTVDVIIPTYKPDETFDRLMKRLQASSYPVSKILIMNTEARFFPDRGYEKLPGVEVIHLPKEEFDHGGTRDRAAMLCQSDLMLFITQDAVPADEKLVGNLVKAFTDETVQAAYARQLPNPDCRLLERYVRSFNYPAKSRVKSAADLDELGIKTFFCSNACAMYRRETYLELGGFEKKTIFNEDMIYAAKIIQSGGSIAYQADARAVHSHNYSCMEQLHRNFDLAVSQADHPEIFGTVKSESEGIRLVKQTAGWLVKQRKPWLIFELVMQSGFKYLGYLLGKRYKKLPGWLVRKLSMNQSYWKNPV
ncbi:MAG: glycosyltransferase family 2 protein [Eubacteriales bacterium]|nr:glycosyltransferase family 2 protein [Eubacteriales bacterium]